MNLTWLNLVLGVPLTYLYHLSAFLWVSRVEPSAFSFCAWDQDTQEQHTQEQSAYPGTV